MPNSADQTVSRTQPGSKTVAPANAGDLRFKTLVGPSGWDKLPTAVQRRFSKQLRPGDVVIYRGRVTTTRLSTVGQILSRLLTVVGSPLPKRNGASGRALVSLHEDNHLHGQVWTRIYFEDGHHPQIVYSTKRFTGPTGLQEHIGNHIAMNLSVAVTDGALVFRSTRYFFKLSESLKIAIPRVLSPGCLEVVHRQEQTDDTFSFKLTLTHPWFGQLVSQTAHFSSTD